MIQDYVSKLSLFATLHIPQLTRDYFCLCISEIGEIWRRFVQPTQTFPFVMFGLANLSVPEFLLRFAELKATAAACPQCVDTEFSSVLLSFIPITGDEQYNLTCPAIQEKIKQVQELLRDLQVFAPLSSDLVECLHGRCQSSLHRFRGAKPSDPVAKEIILWGSITTAFGKARDWLWSQHGDKRANLRLHRFFCDGRNQHSEQGLDARSTRSKAPVSWAQLDSMVQNGQAFKRPKKLCGGLASYFNTCQTCHVICHFVRVKISWFQSPTRKRPCLKSSLNRLIR